MFQPRQFTKGDDNTPILVGKEKELYESKNWPKSFSKHVDITKIKIDAFEPWITKRVSELIGVEDDIVVDYCMSQLKELGGSDAKRNSQLAGDGGAVFNEKPQLDPKRLQISLTGFMAKKASVFVRELWDLLLSAQESEHGIPQLFIEERKKQLESKLKDERHGSHRSPSNHSDSSDDRRDRHDDRSENHSRGEVKRERRSGRPRPRRRNRRERHRHRRRRDRSRSPRSASPRRRRHSSSSDSHYRRRRRHRSRSRERHRRRRSPDSSSSDSSRSSSSSVDRRRSHRKRPARRYDSTSSSSSIDPERVRELSKRLARKSES